jgi:hypothetical protein
MTCVSFPSMTRGEIGIYLWVSLIPNDNRRKARMLSPERRSQVKNETQMKDLDFSLRKKDPFYHVSIFAKPLLISG